MSSFYLELFDYPRSIGPTPSSRTVQYRSTRRELWVRILFVLELAAVGYVVPIANEFRSASSGSLTAYTLTLPVLGALIAAGYTRPPRGVSDAETDWIVAALTGGGGFLVFELITHRLPTLAGLWRLDNLFPVVWVAGASMVVFSVRHVLRMWSLWLFVAFTAPVLGYFLLTAGLGGTEDAAVLVATGLGTVAVFLSTRVAPWAWRLASTTLNLVVALGLDQIPNLHHAPLLTRVAFAGAAVPVVIVLVVHHFTHVTGNQRFNHLQTRFPHRRAWSYPTLVVISLGLLWTSLHQPAQPPIAQARADWTARMDLQKTATYPFIARFLGPGSTLTRYRLPGDAHTAGPAIDVISSPSLARLRDYADAVWYPSPAPVNYQRFDLSASLGAQAARKAGGRSPGDTSSDWYLLTWMWHAGDNFQRVTIVMDQATEPSMPPAPRPITLSNSLIQPLTWVARQQPEVLDQVPEQVVDTAKAIAHDTLLAGVPK